MHSNKGCGSQSTDYLDDRIDDILLLAGGSFEVRFLRSWSFLRRFGLGTGRGFLSSSIRLRVVAKGASLACRRPLHEGEGNGITGSQTSSSL